MTSDLFVVDGPRVRRHELPVNDRGWAPAVCGERWLAPPACSPDGRHVAIAGPYDDKITLRRLRDGACLADVPAAQPGWLR